MTKTTPSPSSTDPGSATEPRSVVLTLVALFKLLKSSLLVAAGLATLRLARGNVLDVLSDWVTAFHFDPDSRYIQALLSRLLRVDDRQLRMVAAGTFIYAALFAVEGIGLLTRRRWAEYFVIITTSLLLPLEVYELVRHASPPKVIVFILNVAIVVYLIRRVWRTRRGQARAGAAN